MKHVMTASLIVLIGAVPVSAQDLRSISLAEDVELAYGQVEGGLWPSVEFGPSAGYLRARGAERGTWFGGVQMRFWLEEWFGIEGSLTAHVNEYEDNTASARDVTVSLIPVEAVALLSLPLNSSLRPYLLGGAGWYFTDVDYDNPVLEDDTDSTFGVILGFGIEWELSPLISVNGDLRYIFVNDPDIDVEDEEFDSYEVKLGANFRF